MTYAYIVGGFVVWGLACIPFLSLARAAGRECPTPGRDIVRAGAGGLTRSSGRQAELAKLA